MVYSWWPSISRTCHKNILPSCRQPYYWYSTSSFSRCYSHSVEHNWKELFAPVRVSFCPPPSGDPYDWSPLDFRSGSLDRLVFSYFEAHWYGLFSRGCDLRAGLQGSDVERCPNLPPGFCQWPSGIGNVGTKSKRLDGTCATSHQSANFGFFKLRITCFENW